MTAAELIWELSKYDKSHTVVTFNPHTGNWDNPTGVSGILGEGAVHMRNDGEWPVEANKKVTDKGIEFIPCEDQDADFEEQDNG